MSELPNSRSQKIVGPAMVSPQLVTDPSILDSVAGFISDVVPTTHNGPLDIKDQIQWAHFEQLDRDEPSIWSNNEYDELAPTDVILVLGYTTGVQVWVIPSNGQATEILSWRHGSPRMVKFMPTPFAASSTKTDVFASKRPLIGICDNTSTGPLFSSLNFISLKTAEQVKVIKFKSSVLGVEANRRSVVVTFQEKFAVFNAFNLEHLVTVSSCYLSPGFIPNPIALGSRWLAYADKKLNMSKKSSGGNEGEGVQSYTATVLYAAKSLSRGLRELGETMASSFTGNSSFKPGTSPNSPQAGGTADVPQKGVVTILDIENPSAQSLDKLSLANDPIVAHFTAHTEAIVHLKFDPSGMLLLTADKRGHDFHLFRIYPHPGGPSLAAVHHLYILHRGDTSAKVQDMCFSPDSRWAAVSTLRGTTHVFPVTPYGGAVGMRTHATPHVVNKMSRFHRSAGLTMEGRSNSPVSLCELPANSSGPYHNPRFPPYPHPTVVQPLAQIRQPLYVQNSGTTSQRSQGRQRISSLSEEPMAERVVVCFAQPRAWLDVPSRDPSINKQPKPMESLLVMSWHGVLVQYDLDPRHIASIPKEKVSSETPIELSVTAKAQWMLQRQPCTADIAPPLSPDSLTHLVRDTPIGDKPPNHNDEQWLSQVEIITHAGPHRRLWMGPQFTFKTYTTASGSLSEAKPIDLGRTKPVNMPKSKPNAVLIESTSASSYEYSPFETYHKPVMEGSGTWETQLKEDLADAMMESPGITENCGRTVIVQMKPTVAKVVNPLGTVITVHSEEEPEIEVCEEIIYENSDEAFFRPYVPVRAVYGGEATKRFDDKIITKSLEGNTEVAVRILSKSTEKSKPKPRGASPKSARTKPKEKVERAYDVPDFVPQPEPAPVVSEDEVFTFEVPPLESEDFFSLDTKADTFEDARDCGEPLVWIPSSAKARPKPKSCPLEDSFETNTSEENVFEEKSITKRPRRPKAKLGVKIVNMDKEKEKTFEDISVEIAPTVLKKSWSSIAASKSARDKVVEQEECDFGLPKIEFMEDFSVQKKPCIFTDFLETNSTHDDDDDAERDLLNIFGEDNHFLKIDKSSDDEKRGSSSALDTTESDDSGNIPNLTSLFEDMTQTKEIVTANKSSRRRKKKK